MSDSTIDSLVKVLSSIITLFIWTIPLLFAWNFVMPELFGLPKINYWQMLCLYLLITSLLGGVFANG